MKILRALAATALPLALAVSACGTTEPAKGEEDRGSATGGPVSVEDARGKTIELDHPASKVVSLEWMQTESLVSLGVMPVAVADDAEYNSWVANAQIDDSVDDVGKRSEPSFNAIMKAGPDLVIADTTNPKSVIKRIEEEGVPVLVLDTADASRQLELMRENFTTIAEVVGKEDKAEELLGDLDQAIKEAAKDIAASDAAGASFAMADGWAEGGTVSIRMFGDGSMMSDLAEEIGLEQAWPGEADPEWGLATTDPEGMTRLPDDVRFFYNSPVPEEDVFGDELEQNPIWTSLPFVEQDHLYKLEQGVWTFGGPVSAIAFVRDVAAQLTE